MSRPLPALAAATALVALAGMLPARGATFYDPAGQCGSGCDVLRDGEGHPETGKDDVMQMLTGPLTPGLMTPPPAQGSMFGTGAPAPLPAGEPGSPGGKRDQPQIPTILPY